MHPYRPRPKKSGSMGTISHASGCSTLISVLIATSGGDSAGCSDESDSLANGSSARAVTDAYALSPRSAWFRSSSSCCSGTSDAKQGAEVTDNIRGGCFSLRTIGRARMGARGGSGVSHLVEDKTRDGNTPSGPGFDPNPNSRWAVDKKSAHSLFE